MTIYKQLEKKDKIPSPEDLEEYFSDDEEIKRIRDAANNKSSEQFTNPSKTESQSS